MLTVDHLRKSYGPTAALRDVTFSARRGAVLGVLGENGAGKSTLVKILAGAVRRDAGSVQVAGQVLDAAGPREALAAGVVLVPQELALVPHVSVAENIMLGRLPARGGMVSRRRVLEAAAGYAEQAGVHVRLDAPMGSLSLAEAQLVEIARALARRARVLLLDEPTAALSQQDSDRLFAQVARLAAEAVTVLVISHRLDEVVEHADDVVVLRDGAVALARPVAEVTKADLVASMLGTSSTAARSVPASSRAARRARAGSSPAPSEPVMAMHGIGHRADAGLDEVDLEVRGGELVVAFSVRGGGQEATVATLGGLMPHERGRLVLDGRPCPPIRGPRAARAHGIVFVPPDRKRQGLVLVAPITDNVALPQLRRFSRWGLVRRSLARSAVTAIAGALALRHRGPAQRVGELSGGNQQKVLLGSRMAVPHRLLVLHEPTRGVDVGARREIHDRLADLVAAGTAVLASTSDVEEAVDLADRLYVLRDGAVVGELDGAGLTAQRALALAVGGEG